MPNILFEAKELHAYYGRSHILHGVNFHVNDGEAVALMGRNGMGKTTLLKSMLGIVRPRHGRVLIRGDDVSRQPIHRMVQRGIAYVPEGRGVFPNLTVRENLVMAARRGIDGNGDWDYDRVLTTFPRLGERINNGGWQLSGGEQQMLSIGRALMTNPDLLILDEATEGLAPLVAKEIWFIIKQICKTGIATVIVDKNLSKLLPIIDRAVILVKGEVVFNGGGEELHGRGDIVKRYLGV